MRVRDDIEAFIDALGLVPAQRDAALQAARSLQMTLSVDLTNKAALQAVGDASMAAIKCLSDTFGFRNYGALSSKIEAMTANTRGRAARYMEYNAARGGSTTAYPHGDTCK